MTVLRFPARMRPVPADRDAEHRARLERARARALDRIRAWIAQDPAYAPEPLHIAPRPGAPDHLLRTLAHGWPEASRGEIPDDLARLIAVAAPDIAQELLAHRAAQDVRLARRAMPGADPEGNRP